MLVHSLDLPVEGKVQDVLELVVRGRRRALQLEVAGGLDEASARPPPQVRHAGSTHVLHRLLLLGGFSASHGNQEGLANLAGGHKTRQCAYPTR